MPSSEIKINPQVLEIWNKFKSGEYLRILKVKLISLKWYFVGFLVLMVLFGAISFGRTLSEKNAPVFVPPIVDVTTPTSTTQKTSVFSSLKRSISEFNPILPDPAIPLLDNNINLEKAL